MKENEEKFINRMLDCQPKLKDMLHARVSKSMLSLGLNLVHLTVLLHVRNRPSIGEIAEKQSVSGAMMTYIMDNLESKGLVVRVPDRSDRRVVRIKKTPKGKKINRQFMEARREHVKKMLQRMNADEKRRFMNSMSEVMDIMEKYHGS